MPDGSDATVILVADVARQRLEQIEQLKAAAHVEHEIQVQFLKRLGLEWTPGEPFVSIVGAQIEALKVTLADLGAWSRREIELLRQDRDGLKEQLARTVAWARDEQAKCHAAEDARVAARSELAYREQDVERLQADVNAWKHDMEGLLLDHKQQGRELCRLKAALREIKDKQGKVCSEFELCRHVACQSSVTSWMIADQALGEQKAE